jgi:hypothetical protein
MKFSEPMLSLCACNNLHAFTISRLLIDSSGEHGKKLMFMPNFYFKHTALESKNRYARSAIYIGPILTTSSHQRPI